MVLVLGWENRRVQAMDRDHHQIHRLGVLHLEHQCSLLPGGPATEMGRMVTGMVLVLDAWTCEQSHATKRSLDGP